MKVTIELEFDTYVPTTQDIIDYVNECGEDLGYTFEGKRWLLRSQVVKIKKTENEK